MTVFSELKDKLNSDTVSDEEEGDVGKIKLTDIYFSDIDEIKKELNVWAQAIDQFYGDIGLSLSYDTIVDDLANGIARYAIEEGWEDDDAVKLSGAFRTSKDSRIIINMVKGVMYDETYEAGINEQIADNFDSWVNESIAAGARESVDFERGDRGELTADGKKRALDGILQKLGDKSEPDTRYDKKEKSDFSDSDYARATQCALLSDLAGFAKQARKINSSFSYGGKGYKLADVELDNRKVAGANQKTEFAYNGRLINFLSADPENFINHLFLKTQVGYKGRLDSLLWDNVSTYFEIHKLDDSGAEYYVPNKLGIGAADTLKFVSTYDEAMKIKNKNASNPGEESHWNAEGSKLETLSSGLAADARTDSEKGKLNRDSRSDPNSDASFFNLKSANINYEGGTPATARNDVTVELVFEFKNLAMLDVPFYVYKTEQSSEYSYSRRLKVPMEISHRFKPVDLILWGMANVDTDAPGSLFRRTYNPNQRRIKIKYGTYFNPTKSAEKTQLIKQDMTEVLGFPATDKHVQSVARSMHELNLAIVDHSLALKEDGNADEWELTISYRGYAQTLLTSPLFDSLINRKRLKARIANEKDAAYEVQGAGCSYKELNKIYSSLNARNAKEMEDNYHQVIHRLTYNHKIHRTFVDHTALDLLLKEKIIRPQKLADPEHILMGKVYRSHIFDNEGAVKEERYSNGSQKISMEDNKFDKRAIDFFFVGDLIHAATDAIFGPDKSNIDDYGLDAVDQELTGLNNSGFKIVTGCFVHKDSDGRESTINIAEIPISLDFFLSWFHENVVKKKRTSYPVGSFIRDLCEVALSNLLSDVCFGPSLEAKIHFKSFYHVGQAIEEGLSPPVSSYYLIKGFLPEDPLSDNPRRGNLVEWKMLDKGSIIKTPRPDEQMRKGPTGLTKQLLYLVIAPMNHNFFSADNNGMRYSLEENFVPYVPFGMQKTGFVKKIDFSKVDSPGLREARFFNSNKGGLMMLSNVYDASFDTNPVFDFYPGGLVWIDPLDLVKSSGAPYDEDSLAYATGIGGYHVVTKVAIKFTMDKNSIIADQNVTAKWVYSGSESEMRKRNGGDSIERKPVTQACYDAGLVVRGQRIRENSQLSSAAGEVTAQLDAEAQRKQEALEREVKENAATPMRIVPGGDRL